MNIKKKLAVFGAFALPFAGLAAFGGAQAASAASPLVTCQIVSPGSGITAGETWTPNSDGSARGPLRWTSMPAPAATWSWRQAQTPGPPPCP